MFPRTLAIVVFALCGLCLQTGSAQDKKKFEVPKDAIAGTVKAVDLKANSFTLTIAGGKDRTFGVDDKTEFYGPKGGDRGKGPKGLKDDTMEKGYEVKVMPTKDGKIAKDVYLPNRKTDKQIEEKKK